jgi:hypothetical protein
MENQKNIATQYWAGFGPRAWHCWPDPCHFSLAGPSESVKRVRVALIARGATAVVWLAGNVRATRSWRP